ncbi:MAG: CPBP family intramembrane metalloprotease [Bacteroidales bacterium]|jgi:membrane protease YdiL (CAAX protease family)|nr:CPBP family intramembrane metalloprotease [Bacteroidales bacterium]
MQKIFNSLKPYSLLLAGGLLLAAGILLSVFFTPISNSPERIVFALKSYSGWMALFFLCLLSPAIEETAFRLWLLNKKWIKYLSCCLFALFSLGSSENVFFVAGVMICYIYLIFFLKNKKYRQILLIALTSTIFSLAHIGNFTNIVSFYAAIPCYLGVSCVCCWLVIRWSFFAAIIFHGLWNFCILGINGYWGTFNNEKIIFENSSYTATIQRVSAFTTQQSLIEKNTIKLNRYTASSALSLLIKDGQFDVIDNGENLAFFSISVTSKDTTVPIDFAADYIKQMNLRIDTSVVEKTVYILTVADTSLFAHATAQGAATTTFNLLAENIGERTNNIVRADTTLETDKTFNIDLVEILKTANRFSQDPDKTTTLLQQKYGLALIAQKELRTQLTIFDF